MKSIRLSLIAALAAATIGLTATANAAPSGPPSVDATIDQLQAQGFDVVVNRVGHGAPSLCTLSAIRPGQTYSRTDTGSGRPGSWSDLVTTVTGKTVYVDLSC